jgi:putative ATPase
MGYKTDKDPPLADKLRPFSFDSYVGQKHLLADGSVLRRLIEGDNLPSMIFWGPPGCGKTTLAKIIAGYTAAEFINFSATANSIKEVREVMNSATQIRLDRRKTVIFIDEIHRFNKAQQDAFLPYVENGSIILIGATTKNPSFEINSALLSRCKVFILKPLSAEEIKTLLDKAIADFEHDKQVKVDFDDKFLNAISEFADGDARVALNTLEILLNSGEISNEILNIACASVVAVIGRKFSERTCAFANKKRSNQFNERNRLRRRVYVCA